MRQFVLGLMAAGLAWWGYDKWIAEPAHAGTPSNSATGQGSAGGQGAQGNGPQGGRLDELLNARNKVQPAAGQGGAVPAGSGAGSAASNVAASNVDRAELVAAVDEALPLVQAGDADAAPIWQVVASGKLGGEQRRIVAALAPQADDFASQLKALGGNNAFLHSVEGRAAAAKIAKLIDLMPDHEAVKAASRLLTLMTAGRITVDDTEERRAVDEVKFKHLERVHRWTCSPANVAGARSYTVKPGNSLDVIARKFRREGIKIDSGTIAFLNRISNPKSIQPGQKLKIPIASMRAVLEKRSFALMLYVGDELLRLYWVGHGRNDHTPVTTFEVIAKQAKPDWTAPDGNVYAYGRKENILGEYFIKFGHPQHSGFGAHGTPLTDSICKQESMGCLRMFDSDIEELYRILPHGALVEIKATESMR